MGHVPWLRAQKYSPYSKNHWLPGRVPSVAWLLTILQESLAPRYGAKCRMATHNTPRITGSHVGYQVSHGYSQYSKNH